MPVYVISEDGRPLMPCSEAKARHLLDTKRAKVKHRTPFTIQMVVPTTHYTQKITIAPVSDLRNYGSVLDKVAVCTPVYLTRNGQGVYSIRDIKDEENFQKAEAVIRLMCELNAGIHSAEEEGWIVEEELRNHLKNRRNEQR